MRRAPDFWWQERPHPYAKLLAPVSALWGVKAGRRMQERPAMLAPVPVVCVGNLVAGGAGKTPTAIAIGALAKSKDFRPGFLTRGYGGSERGPVLVDLETHGSGQVGDEPLLLAAVAPTVVSGDRPRGAERLLAAGVNLIIMDDGFQNPSLGKDLSLVVVDAASGIGNGRVLPGGPLRAPLEIQLRFATAILVIGDGEAGERVIRMAARAGKPALRARLKPEKVKDWRKAPILAYAGIARPEKFFQSLAEIKAAPAVAIPFPDHHRYSEEEAMRLITRAEAEKLRLVTTEKDFARLKGEGGALGELRSRSEPFVVALEFEHRAGIVRLIEEAAERVARRAPISAAPTAGSA